MTFHPILTHYMYIRLSIGGKSYFFGGKKFFIPIIRYNYYSCDGQINLQSLNTRMGGSPLGNIVNTSQNYT